MKSFFLLGGGGVMFFDLNFDSSETLGYKNEHLIWAGANLGRSKKQMDHDHVVFTLKSMVHIGWGEYWQAGVQ